jgi:shikimate kinase
VLFRVAAFAVVVGCAFLLVTKAENGVNTTDRLSSSAARHHAAADNSLYNCLTDEVHKLVGKGTTVAFATDPASPQGTGLFDAAVTWVEVAANPSKAKYELRLVSGKGPGSCSGQVVVARRRSGT